MSKRASRAPAATGNTARDGHAPAPTPASLSLESLIDETHALFNGRGAWLGWARQVAQKLVGVEIDSETPAPHTLLLSGGQPVGRTLSSFYSPALRRAIALAQIENAAARTPLTLTLPVSLDHPDSRVVAARVVDLPFLPVCNRCNLMKGVNERSKTPLIAH